jgi:starch synthase
MPIYCKMELMTETLRILFLAAEAEPYIKVGGLADVASSLPLALRGLPPVAAQGINLDVRLALPLYRAIRTDISTSRPVAEFTINRSGRLLPAKVFETSLHGMPVYFISGEPISNSASVYSRDPALDREKFSFFSLAALEMVLHMDWKPDILHANDWHTALAVYALPARRANPEMSHVRSILTLHNLPYMGGDGTNELEAYGLTPPGDDMLPGWARTQPLPLGLWAADALVPVSPGYAGEILTPDFGCGLDNFLRSRSAGITGILNGLDLAAWNPETDPCLTANFNAENLSRRAANKTALQNKLGLKEEPRIPILAMIGRMDPQKGVDITFDALRQLTGRTWQFVILGSGDPGLENAARGLQAEYPYHVRAVISYDEQLSRLIYGGADMFLMPSRYEPCGLAQMIAMRYGCVPVVHATGGLKDTVQEGKTGFLFQRADYVSMLEALQRALSTYLITRLWEHFQRIGMQEDFSWTHSAARYAILYRSLSMDENLERI